MCGVSGFISKKKDLPFQNVINSMTDSLAHRGPDDRGTNVFIDKTNTVGLGHRRLSILDLSNNGHQPLQENNLTLIFNGEIYNYIEIKNQLQKDYTFNSTGDSEVILKAYQEWGTKCFSKFNGMWAIAIYDKSKNKLILARDRMGKKPFYYYKDEDKIVFASEIKAIFKYPNIKKKMNAKRVCDYLSKNYRYVDVNDESYFEDILQVPKASFIEVDQNLECQTTKFWWLKNFNNYDNKENIVVEEFKELLIDSVKLRLRSDVPVGCFLSGGMDSTSITSIAYKVLNTPITTFSGITGKGEDIYDESEYINEVIKETNATYNFIIPEPADIFDTVEEMIHFHDEPICTVTWYSLYLIAKKMKDSKISVVLNGHGGDELLSGYWDHYQYNFHDLKMNPQLSTEIEYWYKNHNRDKKEIENMKVYLEKLLDSQIDEESRFTNYSYILNDEFKTKYLRNHNIANIQSESLLTQRMHKELFYEVVPALMRPEDRNTMAFSIESRSPFLDHRMIEYTYSLPNKYKIRNGLGKWVLRESMKGILPEKVRTRKDKAGFIAPADIWFKTINKKQIEDILNSKQLIDMNIFDIKQVKYLYQEHLIGKKNHQMFLWQLINLFIWYKKFFIEDENE